MRPPKPAWAAVGIFAAVTAFLFRPLLWGTLTGEPRFFEWDVPEQYWPDLVLLCRSLHDLTLPLWNPYDRGGYPIYADPQAGLYHPLNWAICAVAGPDPGLGWAELRVVLGFFLAGIFGLMWLRRVGFDWGPATLGAAVLPLAPFMRHNWELNLTTTLAWAPLMLWAAEGLAVRRRLSDGAWLALATALCLWSGSPQAAWLAGIFCAGYLAWRLAEERARDCTPALAVAGVLTVALTAAVVVPARRLAGHSVRADADFADMAAGALEPSQLIALVWPQPGNHLYLGCLVLALSAYAFLGREQGALSRGTRRWLGGWVLLAVCLTLGPATPFFELVYRSVPGAAGFRLPHRYEAWMGLAMAPLVAAGLSRVRHRAAGSMWVAAGLVALLAVDVGRTLPPDRHTVEGSRPLGAALETFAQLDECRTEARLMAEFGGSCRVGTRLGVRDLRGYQDPLQLKSYERLIASLRDSPRLAEQLSVRYAWTGPHFIHGWNRHFLPPPEELLRIPGARDLGDGLIELPAPNPFAWWVPEESVEGVLDRPAALERVKQLAPARVAILDGEPRRGTGSGGAVDATGVTLSADRLEFDIDAPGPGVVVVNEAFYPGWTASVDGVDAAILRANGFVRAIHVKGGRHRVVMRFQPADGRPLRALLVCGWVALFGVLVAERRAPQGPR
jgi:hypothetical protein